MKTLKFKTNINCNNCLATAKPYLDKIKNVQGWNVALADPEKILTVEGNKLEASNIIEMVKQAGYKAEPKKGLIGTIFG